MKLNVGQKLLPGGKIGVGITQATVTYHIDTSSSTKVTYFYNEVITDYTASKSGYTFMGWREDTTASSSVLGTTTIGIYDVDLYAVFRQTITLSYNAAGGSSTPSSQTGYKYYNNGNTSSNPSFTLASGISMSSWTFYRWCSGSATGTAYAAGASVTLSSNTTFYATFYQTITLSYNANGGSSTPSSQSGTRYYRNGSITNPSFTLASAISSSSGTFRKWASGNASTGTMYSAGASVTLSSNTTFYAVWNTSTTKTGTVHGYVYDWKGDGYLVTYGTIYTSAPTISYSFSDVSIPDSNSASFKMTTNSSNRGFFCCTAGVSKTSRGTATVTWTSTGEAYTRDVPYTVVTGSLSCKIDDWSGDSTTISYGVTFTSDPTVKAVSDVVSTAGGAQKVSLTLSSISTTKFKLKWSGNGEVAGGTCTVTWGAIGKNGN